MKKRTCGDCTACCYAVAVPDIAKPAREDCPNLMRHEIHGARGCGVYETRPKACAEWRCAWLARELGSSGQDRPDRLGVIFHRVAAGPHTWFVVNELRPGALDSPRASAYIRALGTIVRTLVIHHDGSEERRNPLKVIQ